jgi:lipid-binding SYLF domain-containing protein
MRKTILALASAAILTAITTPALADKYSDALDSFRKAGETSKFMSSAYGYALFPTVGKGGIGIGGAYGKGRVYQGGKVIGSTTLTQASVGFQLGGQAYSQIIFFEDAHTLQEFTKGNFEFGADASAVIITAGATATAGTKGASASASTEKKDAGTAGTYYKGMAVFTIVKGGAMYELSLAGQKFTYKAGGH